MAQKSIDDGLSQGGLWYKLKRFLIFQLKLYVDAIRDVVLSFLAVWAFLADVLFQLKGEDSLFERLLSLGRRTERAINLFNQYDDNEQGVHSIDGLIREVENTLREPPK